MIELVREIAATYVGMYLEGDPYGGLGVGSSQEQLERARASASRLQPAAAQALLASFRTEMAAAVESAVHAVLTSLDEPRP